MHFPPNDKNGMRWYRHHWPYLLCLVKTSQCNHSTMEWRMAHYNLVFLDSLDVLEEWTIIILKIMCSIFSLFCLPLHSHSCNCYNQTKKVTHGWEQPCSEEAFRKLRKSQFATWIMRVTMTCSGLKSASWFKWHEIWNSLSIFVFN